MDIPTRQKRCGLVLEGGAMRGMFTAGVIDVMMEAALRVDGIVGVSAGAAFGCNYKSHQPGRVLRYNSLMANEWRYCSLRSLLTTGDLFGAEFAYHHVPTNVDIFDGKTYAGDPMEYHVVATDVETGRAVYKQLPVADYDMLEWIRASASMPLCSRVVELEGHKLLDGGVADSIPLRYFESQGYGRNIVVLTQPLGYRKAPNALMPLMRLSLRKYPRMVEALRNRHLMYNAQLDYVARAERDGRALVIRPPHKLPIGHISHDPEEMRRVYEIGRDTAASRIGDLRRFTSARRVLVGFMKDGNMAAIRQNGVYYIRAADSMGNALSMTVAGHVDYVLLHTEHNDMRWFFRVEGDPFAITGKEVRAMHFITRGAEDTRYIAYRLAPAEPPQGFDPGTCPIADRSFKHYFITI